MVVGLNSDESIRRIKGPSRPIMNQVTRGELVGSIRDVDHVEVFNEDTPYELIKDIVPHFVVKGGDYLAPDVVGSDISHVEIVPLRGSWSTSRLIDRIKNG